MAELKIKADSGGGTVSLKGPATTTSNAAVQLTLPVDDGSANQYLKTNGSGVMSWATVDTAPEGNVVKSTTNGNEAATKFLRADGDGTCSWQIPDGKIIQVVAGTPDTSARSTTSTTFVTASSTCNVTITPTSASNKILVVAKATFSAQDGNDGWAATIYRGSTNLGPSEAGLAYGNSVAGITALYYPTSLHFIDTAHNTTSAITYQLRVLNHDTDSDGFSVRIGNTNYGPADADNTVPSVMYAMEFA